MRIHLYQVSLVLAAALATPAPAAVDLVTLPRREGTQLTIYNSEDITMVREHRFVKYSVTYKRRKVGAELNVEKKREPL